MLILRLNVSEDVCCRFVGKVVFFLSDGSNFYDSQQGVGRVSVNYRNGLICWVWPSPSNSGK